MGKNVNKNMNARAISKRAISNKNLIRIGHDKPQPSRASKKAGWDRRRERMKIMDNMMKYSDMTLEEIKNIQVDIKKNPWKYTLLEVNTIRYLANPKHFVDFLDRHIAKAPQGVKVDSNVNVTGELTVKQLIEDMSKDGLHKPKKQKVKTK